MVIATTWPNRRTRWLQTFELELEVQREKRKEKVQLTNNDNKKFAQPSEEKGKKEPWPTEG